MKKLSCSSFRSLFFILLSILANDIYAQTNVWRGAAGASWNIAGNWDLGHIPTSNEDVEINNNTDNVVIPTGYAAKAKSVSVVTSAKLSIELASKLNIRNSSAHAIQNSGGINCKGTINISKPKNKGIINASTASIIIAKDALLNIDTAGVHGIENSGEIENSGIIDIDKTDSKGIRNLASGTLDNKADIMIDNAGIDGIENLGTVVNNSNIIIKDVDNIGINNSGTFTNNDTLEIRDVNLNGIENNDHFQNSGGGYIIINGAEQFGINNGASNTLINEGELKIYFTDSAGIQNQGVFSNLNDILLLPFGNYGIYNIDSLYNGPNGTIDLQEVTGTNSYFINNSVVNSSILNEGYMTFGEAGGGITNSGIFTNLDTLFFTHSGFNKPCIHNQHNFFNSNGLISLFAPSNTGIENDGFFHNSSSINIFGTVKEGIINDNELINNGTIYIEESNENGIKNNGVLYNGPIGTISIQNIGFAVGMNNNWNAQIINEGLISFDNMLYIAIYNLGTLSNSHILSISNTSGHGIQNVDSLYNSPTGIITVSQVSSENYGLYNYYDNSINGYEQNTVVNEGIISIDDINGSGIFNDGPFFNYGDISTSNTQRSGIVNTARFYNKPGSMMNIESVYGSMSNGITNSDIYGLVLFENEGTITMEDIDNYGILNKNTLINNDSISMINVEGGIYISDSLYNGPNGIITVTDVYESGLEVIEAGKVVNEGTLQIKDIEVGTGILNDGSIINRSILSVLDTGVKACLDCFMEVEFGATVTINGELEVNESTPN